MSHGSICDQSVVISDKGNGYRGLFATSSLSKGEVLISVPSNLCISVETVSSFKPLQRLFEEYPTVLNYPDEVISLGLMHAYSINSVCSDTDADSKEAKCPWLYHVKALPTSFNTPLYWNDDEITKLRPSSIYFLTTMLKNQIKYDWDNIHSPIVSQYPDLFHNVTIETYTWALSCIYSRAVGIEKNKVYTRVIPPIIDMANHNPSVATSTAETIDYDHNKDMICLINVNNIDKGDECYAFYGGYCNSKLLFSYGFVIQDNPHRAIDLWAKVANTSYEAERKRNILLSHDLTKDQTYDFQGTVRSNYVSPALLATIRVIQINDENEMSLVENAFEGRMISVRNELATYTSLKELLISRMRVDDVEVRNVIYS